MHLTKRGQSFLASKQQESGRASIDEIVLTIIADNRSPMDELPEDVFKRKNIQTAMSRLKRKGLIGES